jgi:tRNA-dihydrouridine synthase
VQKLKTSKTDRYKYGNKSDELYLWTEFMTADGYVAKPEAVIHHLMTSPNQKNLIAQIHGGNIKTLLKTVKNINKKYTKDFIGIELNLGCPAHNIMKSGG